MEQQERGSGLTSRQLAPPNTGGERLKRATFHVRHEYRPVSEMLHGSWSLRDAARRDAIGAHWKCMGSLLLLAFAVEAFCQMVGPKVFGHDWRKGRRIDRLNFQAKFQEIALKAGVNVDFSESPWLGIADVYEARSGLAHAKGDIRTLSEEVSYPADADPRDVAVALAAAQWEPLIEENALDRADADVREGLSIIAKALNIDDAFDSGIRSWSVRAVG